MSLIFCRVTLLVERTEGELLLIWMYLIIAGCSTYHLILYVMAIIFEISLNCTIPMLLFQGCFVWPTLEVITPTGVVI